MVEETVILSKACLVLKHFQRSCLASPKSAESPDRTHVNFMREDLSFNEEEGSQKRKEKEVPVYAFNTSVPHKCVELTSPK